MRVLKNKSLTLPHKEVGILLDDKTILLEDGEWPYDQTPKDVKLFASKAVIDEVWQQNKIGEVLRYDGNIIKWRKECPARYTKKTSWPNDCKEANVVSPMMFPSDPIKALEHYSNWRDWVESNGGNIVGTMSSTSWTIFKASLRKDIWETPFQGVPGIDHPIGGRLLPCKSQWTTFQGDLIQWDLHSAYTRRLSELSFGGIGSKWVEVSTKANFDKMVERGMLVYIEATINLGKNRAVLAPIPRRRKEYHPRPASSIEYPYDESIDGIWTYEEIRNADMVGAGIRIRTAYVHVATGQKYFHRNWFQIIQEGRANLTGYGRGLVKQTGNSLWGRYAMRVRPAKTVWRGIDGKRVWEVHPVRTLKRNQSMELADQLCGKIRSDLFEFAHSAGDILLQGNTDGAWIEYKEGWLPPNHGWRIKHRAYKMELIDDGTYRYWTEGESDPTYVVPGVTTEFTEQYFIRQWGKHFDNVS